MTALSRSERLHDLRTFAAGGACGLLAGALAVSMIVWQYGNVIGSRATTLRYAVHTPDAVDRWKDTQALDDGGDAVLQPPAQEQEKVAATAGTTIGPEPTSAADLDDRELLIPVEGVEPSTLTRQFSDARSAGNRRHEAIDILAPRNTPVRAVENGTIARLFHSNAGGITIYQFDPTERYSYYYAHLERYADGLKEGDRVQKGQILGYVGTSGNAPKGTPHLHFAIFRLTAEKRWWEGTPIDPYDVLR
jgi:murein DD-endopeptidase MepM/ murein hydrolase activator NlpD